jgi:hypothetical protein
MAISIDTLLGLMPPPANPVETSGNWDEVEDRLGTKLPDDYKAFIQAYGSGSINDFASVMNAFSALPGVNLLDRFNLEAESHLEVQNYFGEKPHELYPAKGGLLPVAATDNGDTVYWQTNGLSKDWTIVVNESRGPDYQSFECGLTEFLEGLLTGGIASDIFPASVFQGRAEFRSLPADYLKP